MTLRQGSRAIQIVGDAPVRAAVGDAPVRAARGRLRRYAIGLDVIHAEHWRWWSVISGRQLMRTETTDVPTPTEVYPTISRCLHGPEPICRGKTESRVIGIDPGTVTPMGVRSVNARWARQTRVDTYSFAVPFHMDFLLCVKHGSLLPEHGLQSTRGDARLASTPAGFSRRRSRSILVCSGCLSSPSSHISKSRWTARCELNFHKIAATHWRPNAAEYLWQRRNIGKHFGWFSLLTY
jgi:hypothetical protein